MAIVLKDRVQETTTTTGTSDFVLGGAVTGFQAFSAIGNSNDTYYAAFDSATGDWEVGFGQYSTTGPTLTRATVLSSSTGGAKISFAAGSKQVICTYPAGRSVYLDAAGSAVSVLDIGTLGVTTANITTANITAGTVTTTPASGNDLVNKTYADNLYSAGTGLTLSGTQFSITNTGTAGTYGSASSVPVLVTNAQGQVTSVTNTTISIPNSSTTATSANTASAIVARDGSGNFSAGTITAALSGNATTATTLQTARTINGVSFNGSANITLPTVNTSGNQTVAGAKTFTSDTDFTAGIRWDVSTSDPAHQRADARDDATSFSRLHWYGVSAAGATSNFRHAWYDGAAYINVTAASNTVTFSGALTATQFNGPLSGNATTATTLQTARTINGVSFNGSANITVADATKVPLAGGTMTGTLTVPNLVVSSTLSVRAAIDLADNDILRFGSGDDWEFFHNGTSNYMDLNRGDLIIRDNSTTRFTFGRTTGSLTATGNIAANSDERLKTAWANLPVDFLERLARVKSGTYTRIDNGVRQAGASAQDWQKLLPEVVSVGEDDQGTLSLCYGNAALVSAVELAKRVVDQEARIAKLEALVAQLTKGNTP
jgi:hypothetical protein